MPPPPLFKSERNRTAVIAVLMLLVFVATLALAYLFVVERGVILAPTSIGELVLDVPKHWSRGQPAQNSEARIELELVEPSGRNRTFTVAFADFPRRRTVIDTLRSSTALALRNLIDAESYKTLKPRKAAQIYRTRQFIGVRYTGISESGPEPTLHCLAVFTPLDRNGQQYWIVHVAGPADRDALSSPRLLFEERLLARVSDSAALVEPERRQ